MGLLEVWEGSEGEGWDLKGLALLFVCCCLSCWVGCGCGVGEMVYFLDEYKFMVIYWKF